MKTITEEIQEALAEEELEKSVNGVVEPQSKLYDNNMVTMSLGEFLGYHDAVEKLGNLLDSILEATELDLNKEALRIDGWNSKKILDLVKELRPLEYVERYEKLLED